MELDPVASFKIHKSSSNDQAETLDKVAVEEPLEIRLGYQVPGLANQRGQKSISITMRTPGNDFELAAGFLYTEGIISQRDQIDAIDYGKKPNGDKDMDNTVVVELNSKVFVDIRRLERHFYTTSSCGVCGKASLEALRVVGQEPIQEDSFRISPEILYSLSDSLKKQQILFQQTGGIHASAVFRKDGTIAAIREDVGRHNALDKLVGHLLLENQLPLLDGGIMVSGRASFELMQKSMMARCPMLVAVGAPSSLAVELAQEFNMTLLGFLRHTGFNIYSGQFRLQ